MRSLYSSLFYLIVPFILVRLLWRSLKAPAYRHRWRERFAFYQKNHAPGGIWFHAVSVGDAEALFPLVRHIQAQHPHLRLLITTMTPNGSARVKSVMQESVEHVYLPYDLPWAVNRFIRCFKPRAAVIVETEIWPNLFASCGKNAIPLYIINARLAEKSVSGYQKIPLLVRPALAQVKLIATQTADDAKRFIAIGANPEKVITIGNIKFDLEIPEQVLALGRQLKNQQFGGRFVWLIASTHKGEEALFMDIYKAIKPRIPELLLAIAPRHPERFSEVKKLCEQTQLAVVMRSSGEACDQSTDVYLADSMGELKMLYAAADTSFVGGSMVPAGGHNILEALAVGVPVIFGPHMFNFKEIAQGVLGQDAAIQCQDRDDIITSICSLHAEPASRAAFIDKGQAFVRQNQGAITKICSMLEPVIISAAS
jgi:3-deoxy-D-manno-octulosonic-acid transferase